MLKIGNFLISLIIVFYVLIEILTNISVNMQIIDLFSKYIIELSTNKVLNYFMFVFSVLCSYQNNDLNG